MITTLVAMCAAGLMVHAGMAKRRLEWRKRKPKPSVVRVRRRRP
jgi:hypothetical protein